MQYDSISQEFSKLIVDVNTVSQQLSAAKKAAEQAISTITALEQRCTMLNDTLEKLLDVQMRKAAAELKKQREEHVALQKQETDDLERKAAEAAFIIDKVNTRAVLTRNKIKLNVGGTIFVTTRDTLTHEPLTFFAALLSEHFNTQPDEDGEILIDRSAHFFPIILDHMRGADISQRIYTLSNKEKDLLFAEAEFYQVQSLLALLRPPKRMPCTTESSIILSEKQTAILRSWLGAAGLHSWSLVWRGSRDGFSAKDFHSRCDNRKNTLTIIKSTNGGIFGGFASTPWTSRAVYTQVKESSPWLFTLGTHEGGLLAKVDLKSDMQGIYGDSRYGPAFGGGGHDLRCSDNCDTNTLSQTCLGHSYENWDDQNLLCGQRNFQVADIEVFTIGGVYYC